MRLTQAHVYLLLIVLGLLAGCTAPVHAADGTWVGFEPAAQTVPLGSPAALKLVIKNGVNVNAFDVVLTYDSNALALSSWSHGGFLSNLSCINQVVVPGKLALACTQIARPGVSGDGVLLNLSFTTLDGGAHELVIQKALLAAPQGDTTTPEKQNGFITALFAPTYTPTFTRTLVPPIATSTPYFTATFPPATQVPTSTPYLPPGVTPGNPNTATNIFIATTGIPGEVTSTPAKVATATATNTAPAIIVDLPSPTFTRQAVASPTLKPTQLQITPTPTPLVPETISLAEGLLWGVLGAGGFAIFIMLVILIRRKTRPQNNAEEKDLLL